MANIVELRDMDNDQLEVMLDNSREELFNLRFQHASARLSDVSRIRVVKREIAQLEEFLHKRQLAIEAATDNPDVIEKIQDSDWFAEARFSYEDSAWEVTFFDENDDELMSTFVDLNKKKSKERRGQQAASK
ncbi:MAG: 50S ribosomal protein L29 [Chloroflexota bacterium]|jgi:large subunit ribosomal protein L29